MKMFVVTLLFAISYAQTDVKSVERRNLQDNSADGVCHCKGLLPDTTTDFPLYGEQCLAYDRTDLSPYFEICADNNADLCGTKNWCLLEWCYIDNTDPDCQALPDVQESTLYRGNFYSYAQCGFPDCYTYTVDDRVAQPAGCPVTGGGVDCNCPIACIADWIGDGVCDERSEGVNCIGCDAFWDSGTANTGVFDGGDCDQTTTTQDPGLTADIVGFNACSLMQGMCADTSISASALPLVDPVNDGNNYGCLSEPELGNVGWFAFRVKIDGVFDAWLRAGDSGTIFQFAIWGPFDTTAEAVDDCGTLPVPTDCSITGAIDIQRVHIDDVSVDEIYILMISDNNPVGRTAIINIEPWNNVETDLDCALAVQEEFQCQSSATVSIDFEHARITRHNLGNYYASNLSPPVTDMARGIYYSNVGTYGADTLGLLVTTTSQQYRCHHNHDTNGNMCTHVVTPTPPDSAAFGQVNMFAGDVPLKLQFRRDDGSEDGEELEVGETFDRIKLTVFDIDAGPGATPGGESVVIVNPVSVCPGGVVTTGSTAPYFIDLVEQNNRLDFSDNDFATENGFAWDFATGCWNSRADPPVSSFTVKQKVACTDDPTDTNPSGKCKDNNPSEVDVLNELQQSMAVEAEFHDVTRDGIEMIAKVSRAISTSRNFWFAGSSSSIGRTCCRDKFTDIDCPGGFINGNLECGTSSTSTGLCTKENCCLPDPTTSSHGDPIIHTFHGECYDLHKDGNWLASSHKDYDHDVHVAVYNEYMRQVTVTNKNGDILLAINNYGEIVNNDYPFYFRKETVKCPEDYEKDDCIDEYISISFDAQDMYYDIHAQLRHDYNDQGLREGEVGFHMDVYPQPYNQQFLKRKDDYTGFYFHNPMPGTLETCEERYQRTGQL